MQSDLNLLEIEALRMLQRDPIAEAEKVFGNTPAAAGAGLMLSIVYGKEKRDMLDVLGDTHMDVPYSKCCEMLERALFVRIFSEKHGENNDDFEIWWNSEGLLVVSESYGTMINRLKVAYNWEPNPGVSIYEHISSGTALKCRTGGVVGDADRLVWVGHYDGRDALFTHLKQLRQNGRFLSKWIEQPFLWFLSYTDERSRERCVDDMNKEKYATFPEDVRLAIGPIA